MSLPATGQPELPPSQRPDVFELPRLQAALVGTRFSRRIHHFVTIDSTNTALLAAAAAGAPEGTVYLADEQTAGRGRSNHGWHAEPATGLTLSVLTRPPLPLADALLLSLATGLAVQRAVCEIAGLALDLRWPNDLLLPADGKADGKKVGGILVETVIEPAFNRLRHAVIGIGLNLNQRHFPPQLAGLASSLLIATGQVQPRQPMLIALLRALDGELTAMEDTTAASRAALLNRFAAASSWTRDKRVTVAEQGGYTGLTCGLDERGFLLVADEHGRTRTVLSGGVRGLP